MNDKSATRKSTPQASFLPKKQKKITPSYLENAGAYYLQRFTASVQQFRQVMGRKIDRSCHDHPEQDKSVCLNQLEATITKFIDLGYLNDTSYATGLHYSLKLKGFSRSRIIQTMRQKGLPAEIIEQTVPEAESQDDLHAAIRWCQRKKLGHYSTRSRENAIQRDLASLARAGFSYDCAKKALEYPIDEAQSILDDNQSYR